MAEDVVGARRLLDPVRVERRERAYPAHRLADVPALVGVDGDADVRPAGLARDPQAADVVVEVRADLELDLLVPVREGLRAQAGQLFVGVPEPARGRRVGRIAV